MSIELIRNYQELKVNMKTIDNYLRSKKDPEYTYAINLLKKGTCFIAVKTDSGYRFYPSRFMGYKNNTMEQHDSNISKNGTVTNPQITFILGEKLIKNAELNNEYMNYCDILGFKPREKGSFGVERKFWSIEL